MISGYRDEIAPFEIMVARAREAFPTKNRIDPDEKILATFCCIIWDCLTNK